MILEPAIVYVIDTNTNTYLCEREQGEGKKPFYCGEVKLWSAILFAEEVELMGGVGFFIYLA